MITNGNERMSVGGGFLSVEEFYGLSTDTKPTNTANGSTFFEMDTGKMYRFNYSGATWTETTHYGSDGFGPAPSGGGGSTGGGVLVVNFEYDLVSGNVVGDQKASDVFASFTAGTTVLFHVSIEQDDFYYLVIYASNSSGYNFRFYDPSKDATIEAVTGDDGYVEYFNE